MPWRGKKGQSFTFTKVALEHGKGSVIKQKRKVLPILLGAGCSVRRIKSTYWYLPFLTPSLMAPGILAYAEQGAEVKQYFSPKEQLSVNICWSRL